MNGESSIETTGAEPEKELLDRRLFLRTLGKWSGAAVAAAVAGGAWIVASRPEARAGGWINRRGGYGGGWIDGRGAYGGGGSWVNRW